MEEEQVVMEEAAVEDSGRQLGDEELLAFMQEHPGVEPKSIPKSVWDEVRKGDSLKQAYGRHAMSQLKAENQRLQEQLDAMTRNAANREKSLGSMRSTGRAQVVDDFLMGFDQE